MTLKEILKKLYNIVKKLYPLKNKFLEKIINHLLLCIRSNRATKKRNLIEVSKF